MPRSKITRVKKLNPGVCRTMQNRPLHKGKGRREILHDKVYGRRALFAVTSGQFFNKIGHINQASAFIIPTPMRLTLGLHLFLPTVINRSHIHTLKCGANLISV